MCVIYPDRDPSSQALATVLPHQPTTAIMDLGDVDSDVKLLQVSQGLFGTYFDLADKVLYADDDEEKTVANAWELGSRSG